MSVARKVLRRKGYNLLRAADPDPWAPNLRIRQIGPVLSEAGGNRRWIMFQLRSPPPDKPIETSCLHL